MHRHYNPLYYKCVAQILQSTVLHVCCVVYTIHCSIHVCCVNFTIHCSKFVLRRFYNPLYYMCTAQILQFIVLQVSCVDSYNPLYYMCAAQILQSIILQVSSTIHCILHLQFHRVVQSVASTRKKHLFTKYNSKRQKSLENI